MMSHVVWARDAMVKPLSAKTVLLVLASHANKDDKAYPSIPLLSRECSMTEQGVLNAIKILSQGNPPYLAVDRTTGKHNVYRLLWEGQVEVDAQESALTPQPCLPPNDVDPPTLLTPPPNQVEGYPPTLLTPPPNDVEGKEQRKKQMKEQGKKKKEPAQGLADLAIPEWLPRDVWVMWVDYRIGTKRPMTLDAANLTISGLSVAKDIGWDPIELIHDAIMKGWQGCIYPQHRKPKPAENTITNQPGGHNGTRKETGEDLIKRMHAIRDAKQSANAAPDSSETGRILSGIEYSVEGRSDVLAVGVHDQRLWAEMGGTVQ